MDQAVTYADVLACFGDRSNPQSVIDRLSAEWAGYYGKPAPKFDMGAKVRREWWGPDRVGIHLDIIAKVQPLMITTDKPRRMSGPLVLVDFGGRFGQIDGRRRANLWRHMPGQYEVLILCAS